MSSAVERMGTLARADDRFVVRYNGHNGHVWTATIFSLAVFGALLALYLDDDTRRLIFSRNTQRFKPFSWAEFVVLLGFLAAPLYDLVMTLTRCRPGEMALAITSDGILWPVMHVHRLIPWDDIESIEDDGKYLTLRRHPRTPLQRLFASRRHGASHVRLSSIDCDAHEIFAVVRRVDPSLRG